MAHDLHVFNQAFDLQSMCGEEGVTCTAGMPKFSELAINGSPTTKPQPGNGTHQEDKSAWALEVALDVETSHAIAPMANILLVHSNNAETLGVQGFPQHDEGRGLRRLEPPRPGDLAELRLCRGRVRQLAVAPEPSLRVQERGRERRHRARLVGRRRHGEREEDTGEPGRDACSRSRRSNGRPRIRSSPASAARTSAPTRPRRRISRGRRTPSPTESAPSAAAAVRSTPRWPLRSPGRSRAAASATCSRGPSYQAGPLPAGSTPIPASARGVPDIAFQASAATGALVYLSLPPDGTRRAT